MDLTLVIGLVALVFTILACVAQWLVVPEVRRRLRLSDSLPADGDGGKKRGRFTRRFFSSPADATAPVPLPRPAAGWVLRLADGVRSHGVSERLRRRLEATARDGTIKSFSFASDGHGWLLLYARNGYYCRALPPDMEAELERVNRSRGEVAEAAFGPAGAWLLRFGDGRFASHGLPAPLESKLATYQRSGSPVRRVALGPAGSWVVLRGRNGFSGEGIAAELRAKLIEYNRDGEEIRQVTLLADGGWLVLFGRNGFCASGLPQAATEVLTHCRAANLELCEMSFGRSDPGD